MYVFLSKPTDALNYLEEARLLWEKVTSAVVQVWITLLRPNGWGLFYLPFGSYHLDTTGLWQRVTALSVCSSFPCHFALLCLLNFSSLDMSLPVGLSYWILIQDPLSHSFLLCEWYISHYNSRTERILWPFGTLCFEINAFSSFALICLVSFRRFDS